MKHTVTKADIAQTDTDLFSLLLFSSSPVPPLKPRTKPHHPKKSNKSNRKLVIYIPKGLLPDQLSPVLLYPEKLDNLSEKQFCIHAWPGLNYFWKHHSCADPILMTVKPQLWVVSAMRALSLYISSPAVKFPYSHGNLSVVRALIASQPQDVCMALTSALCKFGIAMLVSMEKCGIS